MDPRQAYDFWASLYDTNKNNTRDLEALALKETLADIPFNAVLEIGCGTGKNSGWLLNRCGTLLGVDLSPNMLEQARAKFQGPAVNFLNANINEEWTFATTSFDLVTFSLVLEHIENLAPVFEKTYKALSPGGYVYVGELHPFKQYTGTKARFDTADGRQLVDCFNHHVSDFTMTATRAGFSILQVNEHFDTPDHNEIPRIITILLRKPN